jgi:small subunit ribosomal protein S8
MSQISDPIGDFLTRVRNSTRAGSSFFKAPHSKMKEEIAKILKDEGFIEGFSVSVDGAKRVLSVVNKYVGRRSVVTDLKRVSRPGLRKYVGADEIPKVLGGIGVAIVSTSSGVMSSREARRRNVGGELLAFVW